MSQTITYMGYVFTGPYSINDNFNSVSGIYLITDINGNVIDVGETSNLKERIPSHERRDCWTKYNGGYLYFHSEDNYDIRLYKEKFLREKNNPKCGKI